jgi:hypothetical protein
MDLKTFNEVKSLSVEECDPEQYEALLDAASREVFGISRAEAYRWIAQHATQQNWYQMCLDKATEIEERLQP